MDSETASRAEKAFLEDTDRIAGEDVDRVLVNREPIIRKVLGSKHLASFVGDVELLFGMIRDYMTKRYREIPWKTIAAAAATLLYILNPFDIIPDFIPGIGYIDDGMVLMLALKMVGKDLEKYRNWRNASR